MHASTLAALASDVRHDTIRFLQAARTRELTWAPPGTSNHILWHAGHAFWVQDALCVRLIAGQSELPGGWERLFGMGSRPGMHVRENARSFSSSYGRWAQLAPSARRGKRSSTVSSHSC